MSIAEAVPLIFYGLEINISDAAKVLIPVASRLKEPFGGEFSGHNFQLVLIRL
jgi:hypothetical protein